MKVVFAGTPEFAARILDSILHSSHTVQAVLTQPDRPAGRGLTAQPSAVKRLAAAYAVPVHQPPSLKDEAAREQLRGLGADIFVVAAYGLILPQAVLDIPSHGPINVHASRLPRWRGAAPIQRAILAGDQETGVCIMQMEAGLDTGPVLAEEIVRIQSDDTAGSLHDRLAESGARLCVETLDRLQLAPFKPHPQRQEGVTYAAKLDKREAVVDWRRPATELDRQVRAFNPTPGASTRARAADIKLWRAAVRPGTGKPGEILSAAADGILVACGEGALLVTELQRSGGKRLPAGEFLRGFPLLAGEQFSLPV
jgi:methionyl-tRNA formyltransferase